MIERALNGDPEFIYVKVKQFTNYQKAYGLDKPAEIRNPIYIIGDDDTNRDKPAGGIWGYTQGMYDLLSNLPKEQQPQDFEGQYMILYHPMKIKDYDNNLLERRYNRISSRQYIRKLSSSLYDLNYETIASDYDMIEFKEPYEYFGYCPDGRVIIHHLPDKAFHDVLLCNLKAFRVFGMVGEDISGRYVDYKMKFFNDIDNLNLPGALGTYIKESFGFHVFTGNMITIDDIVHDIRYNDGKNLMNKIPNLGPKRYRELLKALISAGYLEVNYTPVEEVKDAIYTVTIDKTKENILVKFLEDNNIKYKKRGE